MTSPALTIDTAWGPAVLPGLTTELPDGRVGYHQTCGGPAVPSAPSGVPDIDCFTATWATAIQVPPAEFPVRYKTIEAAHGFFNWVADRGFAVVPVDSPPTDAPLWIGTTEEIDGFGRHCVVGERGRILFDPAAALRWPHDPLRLPTRWSITDLERYRVLYPMNGEFPWR